MVRAVAAAVALVVALPAQGAAPQRAALKLESASPLVVTGRHFGARESVRLTYVSADDVRRIAVRSTRNGSFRVSFGIRVGRCDSFTVRAAGARGTRAVLQVERACEKAKGPPKRALAVDSAG
jgi:hypothetical protein